MLFLFNLLPDYLQKFFREMFALPGAIVDPKGFGFFKLMLEHAEVPKKYRYMFMPKEENAVFVDCGANVGLITDIARYMDMEVYAFEPNPQAVKLLKKKYDSDEKIHLYPYAVSNQKGKMGFYMSENILFDQGATIIEECAKQKGEIDKKEQTQVEIVRLSEVIRNDILPKHKKIHLLKLDIEGAEFDVVNDLIEEGIYKDITYIVVETHERYFKNGKQKLKELKQKIKERKIQNIYLDWI